MTNVNPDVQPLAWAFNEQLPTQLCHVIALQMPPALLQMLRAMSCTEANVAPITSLYDLLAASSTNIIAFQPDILKQERFDANWLYIRHGHKLDVMRLQTLIKAWMLLNSTK